MTKPVLILLKVECKIKGSSGKNPSRVSLWRIDISEEEKDRQKEGEGSVEAELIFIGLRII